MRQRTNRMGLSAVLVVIFCLLATGTAGAHDTDGPELLDPATGMATPMAALTGDLAARRVILVGEHHTEPAHHRAQLEVIRHLHENGGDVAVGLEMFRKDGQAVLDDWVAGRMREDAFLRAYREHWNYPYDLYREIFRYARDYRIPLVGLNVPPTVTRQVARRGFGSLSALQKGEIEHVACEVDDDYRAYIRSAFGAHGHGHGNFEYFCQAQLVWDRVMALRTLEHLEAHPGRRLVLLAGSGHVRKGGIPAQIVEWSREVPLVILPETTDPAARQDADFLLHLP